MGAGLLSGLGWLEFDKRGVSGYVLLNVLNSFLGKVYDTLDHIFPNQMRCLVHQEQIEIGQKLYLISKSVYFGSGR